MNQQPPQQKKPDKPITVDMISERTNYGGVGPGGHIEDNYGEVVEVNIRDVRVCLAAGFRPVGMTKDRAKSLAEAGVVDDYRHLWDEPETKKKAAKQ